MMDLFLFLLFFGLGLRLFISMGHEEIQCKNHSWIKDGDKLICSKCKKSPG